MLVTRSGAKPLPFHRVQMEVLKGKQEDSAEEACDLREQIARNEARHEQEMNRALEIGTRLGTLSKV